LKTVNLSINLTTIGDSAFYYCTGLESITIPDSVTSIGIEAFKYCYWLSSIVIPTSVTIINNGTFFSCQRLPSITIPDSIISIGCEAFFQCRELMSISIPSNVTFIGIRAFAFCNSLTAIEVNTSNTQYASINGMLVNKPGTTLLQCPGGGRFGTVLVPDSIQTIGDQAFLGCIIRTVILDGNVTTIGSESFNSSYLQNLVFHGLSSSINVNDTWLSGTSSALRGHAFAESNFPPPGETWHDLTMGDYFSGDYLYSITNNSITITGYFGSNVTLLIPETLVAYPVTRIADFTFGNASNLVSVTIPSSILRIGTGAFAYCISLTSIMVNDSNTQFTSLDGILYNKTLTALLQCPEGKAGNISIPDTVTNIKPYAFIYCLNMTSITLGANVTTIGTSAFYGCFSLTSVAIPDSVTFLGDSAFKYCLGLTSITLSNNITILGGSTFKFCHNLTNLTLPTNLDRIESEAFYQCVSLESLILPDSLTYIGDGSFTSCPLITIVVPNNVTTLGEDAFAYCGSLTTAIIGTGTPFIPTGAFKDCPSLTTIIIPDTISGIGAYAFFHCSQLTSFSFPSNLTAIGDYAFVDTPLTTITIPDKVTTIGDHAFQSCTFLAYAILSANLSAISNYLFSNCFSLVSINIPSNVTIIANASFGTCTSLPMLTIPGSVTSIGNYTFTNCISLTSLTFLGMTAPTNVGSNWLNYTSSSLRGHANAASDFPPPGDLWNGLLMGGYLNAPTANFTYTPQEPTDLDTIHFTDTSNTSNGTIVAWDWDFGDGGTSDLQNPTHRYADNGIYSLTLEVTDSNGANGTTTHDITIDNVPPIAEPGGPYYGTIVSPVSLDGSASSDLDGTITSWNWNFGDGHTGTGAHTTHLYNTSGNFTITLTVTDNDNSLTSGITYAIILNSPPNRPSNPSPPNGAINVSLSVWLGWTGGDPEGDNVTYDIYLGTQQPLQKISINQSTTNFNLTGLAYNTKYYWQVVSWDTNGHSTTGPLWNFTTLDRLHFLALISLITNRTENGTNITFETRLGFCYDLTAHTYTIYLSKQKVMISSEHKIGLCGKRIVLGLFNGRIG
jgi:PKD repeat protein